jgi:ataxia telangiectasia mutated family protein
MLSLGNVMVISSAVRRAPYFHLLEAVFYGSHFVHHIEAVLNAVSERMGLASFSELFEAYASQIAFSIRQANKDILSMPPHLLGYQGRRECAEATFRAFTPANIMAGGPSSEAIAHGQKLFAMHCKTIHKSPEDGLRDCFGDIVGYLIVFWSDEELKKPGGTLKHLEEQIKARTMMTDEHTNITDHLRNNLDGIIAAILRTLADQDFTSGGAIIQALRVVGKSEITVQTFMALTRYRSLDDVELHKPNLPIYSTLTILHAFHWLAQLVPDINTSATTYHVLHQLFADVQRTPLVNEQIRLLNSISLWVATHQVDFKDTTLLHTLIQGSAPLIAQFDLARAGQSILDWAFDQYRTVGQRDPGFPDVLIRVGCFAHDYSIRHDKAFASIGNDLLQWIDDQALQTCKFPNLRVQVVRALPAWSHQPCPELCQIYDDISPGSLSAVLNEARISSNKFRLVRRFRDLAAAGAYDGDQFAKCDFWRLKECIPPIEQLQKEDVDAFANLLVLHKGRIHSFGSEQPGLQSLRARHHWGTRKRESNTNSDDVSPQRAIVQSLLTMLDSNESTLVHVAYQTLRFTMSLPSSEMLHLQSWAPENRVELEYLQWYPLAPRTRSTRNIGELLSASFDSNIMVDFRLWIAQVTILLSDILVDIDPFFAQITSILHSDTEFAEQVLPVLVHTLLQAELLGTTSHDVSARTCISRYFDVVLTSDSANVSCLRCIVDVALHLRHFRPTQSIDPLGHEKWLDIDFMLLSRNAVICGAYTTALLFLELAAEYGGNQPDAVAAEQILFEIYSHIDEPDGFYGITTTDLRQFLIKRFHHEKQWEKAFRFHGASLEASQTSVSNAEGLLNAFHAFGFDHLAMETLHSSYRGVESNANSSGMNYKLGWRTETWDLPDQRQDDLGASLYLALRAVYRERDPLVVDSIVRDALFEEMTKLRLLGPESLAEIHQVSQNLMCLNQVTHWRGNVIQKSLETKRIDKTEWFEFIHIHPDFE